MPILAAPPPAAVVRNYTITVTDPATGEPADVAGSYLVKLPVGAATTRCEPG